MGNRALVIFESKDEVSPVVYLHWNGSQVPELLQQLKERMKGREGDVSYTAARFIGICHESIAGNLSLGVWNMPADTLIAVKSRGSNAWADKELAEYSHGDAGVVIVNAEDFTFQAYGGYLAKTESEVASPSAA
jgi:hypothetical protein